MPGLLIHDGYSLPGKIPAQAGFPEVNFQYRPALADQLNGWRTARIESGRDATDAVIRVLDKTLISWDVTESIGILKKILGNPENLRERPDHEETMVPITEKTLRFVPDLVLKQLFDIVSGYGPKQQEADVKN